MTYLTDDILFHVAMAVMRIADETYDDAQRIVAPLVWWVSTGRCAGLYVHKINGLTKRQIGTIARRLIPFGGFDYDAAIAAVRDYLDHIAA